MGGHIPYPHDPMRPVGLHIDSDGRIQGLGREGLGHLCVGTPITGAVFGPSHPEATAEKGGVISELDRLEEMLAEQSRVIDQISEVLKPILKDPGPQVETNGSTAPIPSTTIAACVVRAQNRVESATGDLHSILSRIGL